MRPFMFDDLEAAMNRHDRQFTLEHAAVWTLADLKGGGAPALAGEAVFGRSPFSLIWCLAEWHRLHVQDVIDTDRIDAAHGFTYLALALMVCSERGTQKENACELIQVLAHEAVRLLGSVPALISHPPAAWVLRKVRTWHRPTFDLLCEEISNGMGIGATVEASADDYQSRRDSERLRARLRKRVPVRADYEGALGNLLRAEEIMLRTDAKVYVQGGRLVRTGRVKATGRNGSMIEIFGLYPQCGTGLALAMDEVIEFYVQDKEKRKIPVPCPVPFAIKMLARRGQWQLRSLKGVTQIPVLRPDGSVLNEVGYDRATTLYFLPGDLDFNAIEAAPSRETALERLAMLKRELLSGFPFVADVDRSAALSGLMTGVLRRSMASAPMHLFDAPTPGTGKSYFVDMIANVVHGTDAHAVAQGPDDTEMEKRLTGSLIDARELILLDNCTRPIGGELLNQATTQTLLDLRILGKTEKRLCESASAIMATGNNIAVYGDMVRRTILCTLDSKLERPEERTFVGNPKAYALAHRAEIICAVLTIALAYRAAGSPLAAARPVAGFDDYDRLVRQPLVWLGEPDPWASTDNLRAEDTVTTTLRQVLQALHARFGKNTFTAGEVVKAVSGFTDNEQEAALREVLGEICAERGGGLSAKRLAKYLGRNKNRPVGRFKLVPAGKDGHSEAPRYQVEAAGAADDQESAEVPAAATVVEAEAAAGVTA